MVCMRTKHATIFKATLRSFLAGRVKTYRWLNWSNIVMCRVYSMFTKNVQNYQEHKSLSLIVDLSLYNYVLCH